MDRLIQQTVFLPALQSETLRIAGRLSDDEIDRVFLILTSPEFDAGLSMLDSITNRAVTCNDEGSTIFNDKAFEEFQRYEAPQLIGFAANWVANYQIGCEELGLASDRYEPLPGLAQSDVPTLIVVGSLDTATPASEGYRATQTLPRSMVFEVPMAGHVPGLLTECGTAAVHSFILSPDVAPDASCALAAMPTYILPDAELP